MVEFLGVVFVFLFVGLIVRMIRFLGGRHGDELSRASDSGGQS
jgi:Na+-transporting methylmalonyl-CoA/oxaloacetate decarboxylase gamma subunit